MSAIAWLFGLGALTIAFPFLFHLIRRTPKGRTEFSSLMFLKPSPPRLTKRSRLENLLLLLLRSAAILLLAFAFMRPFFRGNDQILMSNLPGRNVAILVDNSASMKRGDLWPDAVSKAKELINDLPSQDSTGLFVFSDSVQTLVDFPESSTEQGNSNALVSALDSLEPNWASSNLGAAIANVADQLAVKADNDQTQIASQIYLVTDFQKSSSLDALQSIQWPANVKLKVIPISSDVANASLQILESNSVTEDTEESDQPNTVRVRIRNGEDSTVDQFQINWAGRNANTDPGNTLAQYVPPGSSRIVRIPAASDANSTYVSLSGDETDFDNQFHFVAPSQQTHRILYLGDAVDEDANGLRHYLSRAVFETPIRKVSVETLDAFDTELPTMTVVADPVDEPATRKIEQILKDGGMVVFAAYDQERVESFAPWIGGRFDSETVRRKTKYTLFANIDFQHPLFATFNSPRYNDFTKIKFWQHATIALDDPSTNQLIASFDDQSPAIWSREVGGGRVLVFSFGWTPQQSRMAFSRKFLPFMDNMLNLAVDQPDAIRSTTINEPIALLADWNVDQVKKPDGELVSISSNDSNDTDGSNSEWFRNADIPGVYEIRSKGETVQKFAVNVDMSESDTSSMNLEQLEALGIKTGEQTTAEERADQMRTMKDKQLESQQKIWKWAIVAVVAILLLETFLGARKAGAAVEAIDAAEPATA